MATNNIHYCPQCGERPSKTDEEGFCVGHNAGGRDSGCGEHIVRFCSETGVRIDQPVQHMRHSPWLKRDDDDGSIDWRASGSARQQR